MRWRSGGAAPSAKVRGPALPFPSTRILGIIIYVYSVWKIAIKLVQKVPDLPSPPFLKNNLLQFVVLILTTRFSAYRTYLRRPE